MSLLPSTLTMCVLKPFENMRDPNGAMHSFLSVFHLFSISSSSSAVALIILKRYHLRLWKHNEERLRVCACVCYMKNSVFVFLLLVLIRARMTNIFFFFLFLFVISNCFDVSFSDVYGVCLGEYARMNFSCVGGPWFVESNRLNSLCLCLAANGIHENENQHKMLCYKTKQMSYEK